MFERIKRERNIDEHEGGFTLIELLVVIAILGILAAIVVFSVAGIQDKGQRASCSIDTQTLQTAEEANFAAKGTYANMTTLMSNGFLSTTSTLHNVTTPANGTSGNNYVVTEANGTCGNTGEAVGNIPSGATGYTTLACNSNVTSGPGASGWGDC